MAEKNGINLLPHSIPGPELPLLLAVMPFVDDGHPLHDLFPPRVWAIRIPVILTLLGSAVVGSFLGVVMIRSNRKKAAKAKAASKKKA
ncbi:dolichyl-phosphate mannosyltransferase polypeptide 2 [Histoplasma capsulatum var. duboisii H88]|uniref:Dolichol phosphate-mannose biosynthesis regulatory protein n=1 Tax=Ajellomyces capsulatus (strain H88) TaxID=544711 RepID=F0UL75_AJEC8|nr:dolichyl-phosphate mannosyltransferase polypeptide 2 [Histoplasma capsulatum var. duboisii H88]